MSDISIPVCERCKRVMYDCVCDGTVARISMMPTDEVNELVRELDERIDELRQQRDEARGVAAQLLSTHFVGQYGELRRFVRDFSWLQEYMR